MTFRISVIYHQPKTVYERQGENYTVAKRWAMMASLDPEVKRVNFKCESVTQQVYVNGKGLWDPAKLHLAGTPQCPHGNSHD